MQSAYAPKEISESSVNQYSTSYNRRYATWHTACFLFACERANVLLIFGFVKKSQIFDSVRTPDAVKKVDLFDR